VGIRVGPGVHAGARRRHPAPGAGHFHAPSPGGGTEPLGRRIVEVPKEGERFELRDSRVRFVAWVPRGSVARGEALARTGGGVTAACASCHGPALRGGGTIPGIAGRSPSYVVRQLYDMKHGARAGTSAALMKRTVEKLAVDDMIALAAYLATLAP
jgi:cytochrome c553